MLLSTGYSSFCLLLFSWKLISLKITKSSACVIYEEFERANKLVSFDQKLEPAPPLEDRMKGFTICVEIYIQTTKRLAELFNILFTNI